MELTVRGEVFKITLVNNYVHEKYIELMDMVFDIQDVGDGIEKALQDIANPDNTKEKITELSKTARKLQKSIALLRREIVKELVISNGYEYSEEWWTRKTSHEDINDFMLACVRKDEESGVKKSVKKK